MVSAPYTESCTVLATVRLSLDYLFTAFLINIVIDYTNPQRIIMVRVETC